MRNLIYLAVVTINVFFVSGQQTTNHPTQPTIPINSTNTTDPTSTKLSTGSSNETESSPFSQDDYKHHTANESYHPVSTEGTSTEVIPECESSILSIDQNLYRTDNASYDPGDTEVEVLSGVEKLKTLVEPCLDIHLVNKPHCTEYIENENLTVTCPDATSLYIYAKKKIADIHHLHVRVISVSGPLDLSQIIGLNTTLRELDLRYSNLTAFSYTKQSHQDFRNLSKLNLNGNREFNKPSFTTVGYLPNLQTLQVHGLKLDNSWILSKTFLKAAPNIEHLDISNTGISYLLKHVFENTQKLKILDASMNKLYALNLETQLVSRLIHLNVSHCKLKKLEIIENGGSEDKIIEVLDVSHNYLPALRPGLVYRLVPDAALYIEDNQWECSNCSLYHLWEYLQTRTTVPGGSQIKSCFDLSSLGNCSWDECPCGCTCTEATKTVNCTNLGKSLIPVIGPSDTKILILNNNRINSLKNINSSSWCQVREIQIDHNILSNFETFGIQGSCSCISDDSDDDEGNCLLQNLIKISAANNNFIELQSNNCSFPQKTEILNLAHNEVKKLGAHDCDHTNIKDLDVSFNQIEEVEVRDLGTSIPYIEKLILSNNQLHYFNTYHTNILPNLKYLDLSHNKIIMIENKKSSNNTKGWEFDHNTQFNLENLYLHNNQLRDSEGFLQVTNISKSLKIITLYDNLWDCDCDFCESFKEIDVPSIDAIDKMDCRKPRDTTVIEFLMSCSLQCSAIIETDANTETEDWIIVLIILVLFFMIMTLSILFQIQYCSNTCVIKMFNDQQTQAVLSDETQGRKYDVFVVHAGADRDFVNEYVITPLARKGYLVAWHENMFTPGNYIYENIEKAVKKSRRMLVVATENFTRSHWGIREVRRGRHEEVDVPGYKITALVTDTLPRDLRPELYQIVQERTHIAFGNRYIEKICEFLPQPEPSMVSSLDSTISNTSLREFCKQILAVGSSNGDVPEDSLSRIFQVCDKDIQNGQITFNAEFQNNATENAGMVVDCTTVNKTKFKILPENDESYKENNHSQVKFRSLVTMSGESIDNVEIITSYKCLPPTPEDDEEEEKEDDFPDTGFSRGIFVRVSARF